MNQEPLKEHIYEKGYFYLNEGEFDVHLFHEGTFYKSYEFFGAHPIERYGVDAVRFTVYAPNAAHVALVGAFNEWSDDGYPMQRLMGSGIYQICVPNVQIFDAYKYKIHTQSGDVLYKADPYAFHAEERPHTASKYFNLEGYIWHDQKWMKRRAKKSAYERPMSIYEVNLLSWRQKHDGAQYSYRDLAKELVAYVKTMHHTHIELMPIMEHPFDGSWGYQVTGYYAPTSRFGTPDDLMYLIDVCHQNDIGVILDWVPVHFCKDAHGLYRFDGTPTYESGNPDLAENDAWGTANFDYGKPEVQSFLISNLIYWHDRYHVDGIRVDAVAYMLYLNFSGKVLKNKYGGYENLEAIAFIKKMNEVVFQYYPDTLMMAEESTSYPMVTWPTSAGGLGFNFKWNMGWMNDILEYMALDPVYRSGFHSALTFTMTYAFSENFVLPLSHDEVVHGKKSLLEKMPGSYEDKFANLRLLYAYMFAHPGKKLLFMGNEFAQFIEWNEWQALDWHLLNYDSHHFMQLYIQSLNKLYLKEPCLYELDTTQDGYEWIEVDNKDESIISFERLDKKGRRLIALFNFTPVPRHHHPIGVTEPGAYKVVFNAQSSAYGGIVTTPHPTYEALNTPEHGRPYAIRVVVPPYGALYIKKKDKRQKKKEGQ